MSRCSEKFFNGNFVRNKDEIAINSRYAKHFSAEVSLALKHIAIPFVPGTHYLKFLCFRCDRIIAAIVLFILILEYRITSKEQESEMAIAYVALGSNLGDKKKNLQRALMLMMQQGVEVLQVSGYFATEPYGVTDQPQFLNAVCKVRTNLEPVALLRTLLATELAMGRVRLRHWGERNIDLDLLLYENVVMQTPELTLPHPDMQNRDFVLLPLLDIAPELVHPLLHKTVREMAAELNK